MHDRCKDSCSKFGAFLYSYYLPIGLLSIIVLGALWPTPGLFFNNIQFKYVSVPVIFLISGLKLKTDEIREAFKAWRALIWALLSILLVTPALGISLTNLLPFDDELNNNTLLTDHGNETLNATLHYLSPFGNENLRTGFYFILVAPCTISSGVVMVTQVQGNYALALLLTVTTNIIAVFTIAPLLNLLTDLGKTASLDIGDIIFKLGLTVVLPLLVGKCLTFFAKIRAFVKRFPKTLSIISMTMLIMIPWMKISEATNDGVFSLIRPINIVCVLAWSWAIHILFLIVNAIASFVLCMELESKKCVIILASQKTIAIAVSLISYLPDSPLNGLMSLSPIIFHMSQIIIDGVLVAIWKRFDARKAAKEAAKKENEMQAANSENSNLPNTFVVYESTV